MRDIAATLLELSVSGLRITAVLILALLMAAVVIYVRFCSAPDGSRRSLLRFVLGGLAISLVAGVVGMGLGIAFSCSYSLGNLCGLGGVFFSGPLAFGLALAAYLFRWARGWGARHGFPAWHIGER